MFERKLLDSARSYELSPEAVERAWLRFSGSMAAGATAAGLDVASSNESSARMRARYGAAKYLLIGALSGSALMFAWLGMRAPLSPRGITVRPTALPTSAPPPLSSTGRVAALDVKQVFFTERIRPPHRGAEARTPRAQEPTLPPPAAGTESSAPSTLAAEVAALDAARAAARAGAYNRALDLLGQYQRDFPAGALGADADVATIEVLYAKRDRAEATRRAEHFLAQFPNDPHSAVVKRLLTP